MAYQKRNKSFNRRIFKFSGFDKIDGERTYVVRSIKFKNKDFARPIILTEKLANDYILSIMLDASE